MELLNKLHNINQCNDLDDFILENIEEITAFFNSDYEDLFLQRFTIEDYIISNSQCLNKLDYSKYYNSYFILSFLDYFERFKLPGGYQVLYKICRNNQLSIGNRQEAAYLYLVSISKTTDHFDYLTPILTHLQEAKKEEDNELNILISLANYLSNVISNTIDFNKRILQSVLQAISESKSSYSFLSNAIVDEMLSVNIADSNIANGAIQKIIEKILKNRSKPTTIIAFPKEHHLIEINTDYCASISDLNNDFNIIRRLSITRFNLLPEEVRYRLADELGRGVKIIDNPDQLYAYMTLYGNKHKIKLQYAYNHYGDLIGKINIIDWGCGQGLASMLLLEHFFNNKKIDVGSVTLIEPSLFSLKRAALHVNKYGILSPKITTINSDFDSLKSSDLNIIKSKTNFHLFSNVLDMETFNANNILNIIDGKFTGENLFVCVSPYITAKRTDLLDIFMGHFKRKHNKSFRLIHKVDIRNQDPTLAVRIFSVSI